MGDGKGKEAGQQGGKPEMGFTNGVFTLPPSLSF